MPFRIIATSETMLNLANDRAGVFIALFSAVTLAGAFAFEYIGGFAPCPLCLEQRLAYYAALPLGLLSVAFDSGRPRISAVLLAVIAIGFAINAVLGVYHSGVEWDWWEGPQSCAGAGTLAANPEDLLRSLSEDQVVRCDEAALRIFGLSLAGYSAMFSAFLAGFAAYATINRYRSRPA